MSLGLTLCGYLFTGVSTDMPNFSHKALVEKFGHKETLTYVYFLKHGRPSFAFTSFMAKYRHRKYIPKARYDQLTLFILDHSNNPGYIDSSFSYFYQLFFLPSKRNRQNNFYQKPVSTVTASRQQFLFVLVLGSCQTFKTAC